MTPPPILELIPHRPPMLLLDRVLAFEADRVVCAARPTLGGVFVTDGAIAGVVTLEYMAQATAACLALARPDDRAVGARGLLIAARRFSIACGVIAVDTELEVVAALTATLGAAASFVCSVDALGKNLASAELTVYLPSDPI